MHLVTFIDLILMIFIELSMFIYTPSNIFLCCLGGQAASLHPPAPLFRYEQSVEAVSVNSVLCESLTCILVGLGL